MGTMSSLIVKAPGAPPADAPGPPANAPARPPGAPTTRQNVVGTQAHSMALAQR